MVVAVHITVRTMDEALATYTSVVSSTPVVYSWGMESVSVPCIGTLCEGFVDVVNRILRDDED